MLLADDIFAFLRKGREMTQGVENLSNMNTKSISRRAQASTCQFPCLIPDTIPLTHASVICKNMDRVYASFIQTVVSSDPLIDITIDRSPLDYMKRLHQNLRLESVIDEEALFKAKKENAELRQFMESECPDLYVPEELYEETVERIYNGEYKLYLNTAGTFGVAVKESVISLDVDNMNKALMESYLSSFDLHPFPVTEAPDSLSKSDALKGFLNNANNKSKMDEQKSMQQITKDMSTPRLVDRDAKRVNELQPYGLSVRLMAVNDKKEFVQYMDFIIGIKTILHVCKSKELVEATGNILKNRNPVFNFIKWTTGEISFVKDFLLHIDEMKIDTTYRSRGANPWIPTLKRLKEKKVKFSLSGVTKLVPNATMVLSSFEVEDIRREYGVDVRDTYFAKKLMQELFLLSFIIVDEGSETIDILYEGADSFETYTLETLQKEVDMSSNKLGKEIGRMISQ